MEKFCSKQPLAKIPRKSHGASHKDQTSPPRLLLRCHAALLLGGCRPHLWPCWRCQDARPGNYRTLPRKDTSTRFPPTKHPSARHLTASQVPSALTVLPAGHQLPLPVKRAPAPSSRFNCPVWSSSHPAGKQNEPTRYFSAE